MAACRMLMQIIATAVLLTSSIVVGVLMCCNCGCKGKLEAKSAEFFVHVLRGHRQRCKKQLNVAAAFMCQRVFANGSVNTSRETVLCCDSSFNADLRIREECHSSRTPTSRYWRTSICRLDCRRMVVTLVPGFVATLLEFIVATLLPKLSVFLHAVRVPLSLQFCRSVFNH